jgi:hypothetical protein
MTTIYSVLPQNLATIPNLATSLQSWLKSQVKVPFDAYMTGATFANGLVYDPVKGTWASDGNGLGILESQPSDPSLFVRSPAIGYCIDDGRSAKPPRSTGCGDRAVWEYHPVTIAASMPLRLDGDGKSTEPNTLARDMLKTFVFNALSRTLTIPFVDLAQPIAGGFATVGYMYVEDFHPTKVASVKDALNVDRGRFEVEFQLRFAVVTTNG